MPPNTPLQRALAHHNAGRIADAETLYRSVLADDPQNALALHGLGLIAHQRGDHGTALDLIEDASERRPDDPVFLSNLAAVCHKLDMPERAKACCERALEINPRFADAYTNHGHALCALGKASEAETSYRKALELAPSPSTRVNAGVMRLLHGDYPAGLPLYEARLHGGAGGDTPRLLQSLRRVQRWRGEKLEGRSILVWTEQGLGDTVMMLRYLPLMKARGAKRVSVCCEAPLARLVRGVEGVDEVYSEVERACSAQRYDLHTPTMSLPLAFGTTIETIPHPVPYLHVPQALLDAWGAKLAALPSPRVGLVWSGGGQTAADAQRSIALASFAPMLSVRGISWISLQKGPRAAQAESRRDIVDWMGECGDLLDTAALVAGLDLVICVDTAVAHLAGALGKPVWLLNRRSSEWRWMLERSDSPWYPTMRIFRSREAGWTGVIAEVTQALKDEIAPRSAVFRRLGAMFGAKA